MGDPSDPLVFSEREPEQPPEDILQELEKLGLEGQRFSPLDYGRRLADYVGATIKIVMTKDKQVAPGIIQRLRMAFAINRTHGDFNDPEEAATLLRYARKLADLSYDPEENKFVVLIPTGFGPLAVGQIAREVEMIPHRIRLSIRRPGYFWRKHYFSSYALDLAVYRQLSHIACGHPAKLPENYHRWSRPPIRRLAEQPLIPSSSPDETERLYEREADRRALWLLKLTKPKVSGVGRGL
jgi:hypothetical protein